MIFKIQITGLILKVLGLASGKARAYMWEGRAGPIISAFQCGKISRSQELKSHHKPLGSKTLPPDSRIFREVGFKMSPGHHTSPYDTVLWDLPVWTNHSPCHSQSLCVLQPFFS